MSSRRHHGELEFGSDSFLDIIANIVGILIILIVVAGMKVARQPVDVAPPVPSVVARVDEADAPSPEPQFAVDPFTNANSKPKPIVELPAIAAVEIPPTPKPPPVNDQPSAELVDRQNQLTAEIAAARDEVQQLEESVRNAGQLESQWRVRLTTSNDAVLRQSSVLQQREDKAAAIVRQNEAITARMASISRQIVDIEGHAGPIETVRHNLTPVGRDVTDKEFHFRISANRIAFVPLDALIQEVKSRIDKNRDWLIKLRRHEGSVGPIDGFIMRYIVAKQATTIIDELKYGGSIIRIGVERWEIVPDPGCPTESVAEALQPGSRFARQLQRINPDSTLTFWVYPDSFETFRVLRKAVHEIGYDVAARPLPFGTEIAGSPYGMRSSAQ